MAYSDFTIRQITEQFGIQFIENQSLFSTIHECELPEYLANTLKSYLPLALNIRPFKVSKNISLKIN